MTSPTDTTTGQGDTPEPDERLSYRGPIHRLLTRPEIGALIGTAGIWVFFWAVSDVFGTVAGTNNVLDVASVLGIMAIAVAMLMVGGEFDLSSGAMIGASGMLVVLLAKEAGEFGGAGLPLFVGIPITFAFAMGIGWANGTLVEKTALPSFIVTLGTFFVLKGAKLGFAKLFTDKVIVEGLDAAPDFEFWDNIFGAEWTRNNQIWDSFLGGRDIVYAVLLLLGGAAIVIGLLEQTFKRRDGLEPSGLTLALIGASGATAGIIALATTDGVGANWLWSIVLGIAIIVALVGFGRWRYEPVERVEKSTTVQGTVMARNLGLGLGAIALGVVAGLVLDSESQTEVGFLLTVQGLRAVLFVGLAVTGLVLLILAARHAKEAPIVQAGITVLAAVLLVVLAFIVQSEASSRKFRAEFFAWLLVAGLALLSVAILRLLFTERRHIDPSADRFGRRASIIGMALVGLGVVVRLLFATSGETIPGIVTYRISVFYFVTFAAVATWVLLRTRFGSWTFAVGGNKSAARQVGVPAARTKTILFMVVSGAAWLGGMLTAFRLNSVQANVGDGQEFLFIIAAVVGGTLLTGGYGSTVGAAIGAFIMAMSFQGIPFSGWNSDWRFLFLGVILLLSVLVNNWVRKKAEGSS